MKTNNQFYTGTSLGAVLELSTSLIGGAELARVTAQLAERPIPGASVWRADFVAEVERACARSRKAPRRNRPVKVSLFFIRAGKNSSLRAGKNSSNIHRRLQRGLYVSETRTLPASTRARV